MTGDSTIMQDELPRTRREAIELGSSSYFTGKECKNGHIALRAAVDAKCCECRKIRDRDRYKRKREHILKKKKEYRQRNLSERRAYDKKRYWEHRDRLLSEARKWYASNQDYVKKYRAKYYQENRQMFLEMAEKWRRLNPEKRRMSCRLTASKRRASKGSIPLAKLRAWKNRQRKVCY